MNANANENENILPKIKTPSMFYIIAAIIIFLIIMMFLVLFDVNLSFSKPSNSKQEMVGEIFIVLFFSLLVFGLCVLFLPNMKEFKQLFEQINNVTYVILYTIFAILFYTMVPSSTLDNYSYIINPIMLILGGLAFYKSSSDSYIEKFNINYERIKMIILLFCLITLSITFYNINPGGAAEKYFGYSLLLTIIISVFAFLYIIILLTLPEQEGRQTQNLLSNFSSFGVYGSIGFILFLTRARLNSLER
jgi:cytochrome bd-type quinol oxidase subunit 2